MAHRLLKSCRNMMSLMNLLSTRQVMCPPGYYQSARSLMVTHALRHAIHNNALLGTNDPKSVQNKSSIDYT